MFQRVADTGQGVWCQPWCQPLEKLLSVRKRETIARCRGRRAITQKTLWGEIREELGGIGHYAKKRCASPALAFSPGRSEATPPKAVLLYSLQFFYRVGYDPAPNSFSLFWRSEA